MLQVLHIIFKDEKQHYFSKLSFINADKRRSDCHGITEHAYRDWTENMHQYSIKILDFP